MPKSKGRSRKAGKQSRRSRPPATPDQAVTELDEFELDEDAIIRVHAGRRPRTTVTPGPGNRAGISDDEAGVSFIPRAMIFDTRLGTHATVVYGWLLMHHPPLLITWDELEALVLEQPRHPDDSAEETLVGLEQLRTHAYLVPCDGGWTLDVPPDAEDHAFKPSEQR
ncbi:hypothetical protein [Nocardia brasiliensis]|uniref:hypothetical protein n=1 Tax=Nocardia brasiliensis TaxID=37326 RepID=UPI002455A977|nr:hypothetical protein [Nocardia brasiliensis]